jgi:hypothetical protein
MASNDPSGKSSVRTSPLTILTRCDMRRSSITCLPWRTCSRLMLTPVISQP